MQNSHSNNTKINPTKIIDNRIIERVQIRTKNNDFIFYVTDQNKGLHHFFNEIFDIDIYGIGKINFCKGDIAIDIGANVGIVSIYLAKKYPEIKVYSFEPSKISYQLLIKNIQANNIKNIQAYNLAVEKESDKKVNFHYIPEMPGASGIYSQGGTIEKVTTISLDDILIKNRIQKVKFLKIDCEGSEFGIIYKSKKFNHKSIEHLSIEIHGHLNYQRKESLLEYIFEIISPEKVSYMFSAPGFQIKNSKYLFHKIMGKAGLYLKKLSPKAYRVSKKIISTTFPPKWKVIKNPKKS
jgi:FkbM family methyltransferase